MKPLVWAEQSNGQLRKSALHAIGAAAGLGPVTVLVVGAGATEAAATVARLGGIAKTLTAAESVEYAGSEELAPLLQDVVRSTGATHLFAAGTPLSRAVLPRLCALLDVMQISEAVRILSEDTFVRPLYAGSAMATVTSVDPVKVATIRINAFAPAVEDATVGDVVIEHIDAALGLGTSIRTASIRRTTTDVDLADARVVISGGRGMGSAAQYGLLKPLADKLGAALGASRAAVDAGYAPPDRQVGQTGSIVAPELYLAFGISGAVQHLAGMKDSRKIVAVNKDPEAPIFQMADVGLVADLFDVLPVLEKAL